MPSKRYSPRNPRRSLRLAQSASIWTNDALRRSRRLAENKTPDRDNLASQRRIIAICIKVLGDSHKVHFPRKGAPGELSTQQLSTFARLEHTVPYFSVGKTRRDRWKWLRLNEDTGEYTLGYGTAERDGSVSIDTCWSHDRAVDEAVLRKYLAWRDTPLPPPHTQIPPEWVRAIFAPGAEWVFQEVQGEQNVQPF